MKPVESRERPLNAALASLVENLELIRGPLSSLTDTFYVKDADGRYLWLNETCAGYLGLPVDEVVGLRAEDFLGEESVRRIQTAEDWVLEFGQTFESEESFCLRGETYTFLLKRSPIRDELGHVVGIVAIGRDISKRRDAIHAIVQREAGLEAAQHQARLGSWQMERGAPRMAWSTELFHLFDLDPDQEPPTPEEFLDLIHPEDRTEIVECFKTLFDDDAPRAHVFRSNPDDGPIRYFDSKNDRHRGADGRISKAYGTLLDITERVQTESALRKSEERFSKIFRSSPIAIAYSQLETGRLIDVNDQYAAFFGYRREELLGASSMALYADSEERKHVSGLIRSSNSVHNLEVRFRHKDGSIRDALLSLEVLPLDDEMVLLSMVVDITDRKRAEMALTASESRMRTILETEPECVKVVDRVGNLLDMNPAGLAMIEAESLEMVLRQPARLLVAEEHRDRYVKLHEAALAGGSGYLEFEIVGLKGTRISVETHSVPFFDDSGSIIGVLSITRNVTARMQAEQALRESEERYRHLFESNPQPMWVYDLDSLEILAVNDAALDQYGYAHDEFVGMKITDIRPPEDVEELLSALTKNREGIGKSGIWRHCKKSGEVFHADIRSHPILWMGRPAVVVMATDVTQRLEAEEAIRSLNSELERRVVERTVQMESANRELEAFCYSVSHDLRTPLRAISGFASALAEDYGPKLDAEAADYLNRITSGTQRMTEVINDLLRLSRVSRADMNPSEIDLSQIANQVVSELRSASEGRVVDVHIQPGLCAHADRGLARVALENLLQNAWKFTGNKTAAKIEFGMTVLNDGPVLFVRDDGAGFDMAYSNKLFGVFERLHRAGEFPGTGIGLATVHRIIHRHGGMIWAEAEVGKGATFYFTFPCPQGAG